MNADVTAIEAREAAQSEDEPSAGASVSGLHGETEAIVTPLHEWRPLRLSPDSGALTSVTLHQVAGRSSCFVSESWTNSASWMRKPYAARRLWRRMK